MKYVKILAKMVLETLKKERLFCSSRHKVLQRCNENNEFPRFDIELIAVVSTVYRRYSNHTFIVIMFMMEVLCVLLPNYPSPIQQLVVLSSK